MNRRTRLPELLAPAGDMAALYAAVAAGADAVYIGGERYGARAYAKNFTREEIRSASAYCHSMGVRLYVTVNTLIYDREMDGVLEYCEYLASVGVDALIVCDMGLISALRQRLPDLELHASTQMGIHNTAGADFAYALGLRRVVLARECSLRDIREVCNSSLAECEIFVHGALCVCHSGQCLFSSMVGGRSGNRGECAQPCRLPYNGGRYPLSLKDLSLASHIPEILASGASSLKIEGRMKSPSYVYGVVSIYRCLLDEGRAATEGEVRRLAEIFSRDGFTDGYFTERFSSMTGVRRDEDKRSSRDVADADIPKLKARVRMRGSLCLGKPSSLSFELAVSPSTHGTSASVAVTVLGQAPEVAKSAPLDASGVAARLMKLGSTDFCSLAEDISLEVGEGINLAPSAINDLRRRAVEALSDALLKPIKVLLGVKDEYEDIALPRVEDCGRGSRENALTATVYNPKLYFDLKSGPSWALERFDRVFIPHSAFDGMDSGADLHNIGVILPPVIMPREWQALLRSLEKIKDMGVRYALVSNIGHISLCEQLGFFGVGDIRLNISNRKARELYSSLGLTMSVSSVELTLPMARDVGAGVLAHGRIPLMITERCFVKDCAGCDRCGSFSLEDRYGERFPVLFEYGHRCQIFNSRPTCTSDRQSELSGFGISHRHFIFSCESARRVAEVLSLYDKGQAAGFPVRRIGKR